MEKLVSISKAADLLGVHISTLRNWDKNNFLKPVKTVGGHRRYKLSDIHLIQQTNEVNDE